MTTTDAHDLRTVRDRPWLPDRVRSGDIAVGPDGQEHVLYVPTNRKVKRAECKARRWLRKRQQRKQYV
jgi:hypothetical protein